MRVEGAPWFLKWNAGSWPAPLVQDANSAGWAGADTFGAAECEACCKLLLPLLLPVAGSGPAGSATADFEACGEQSGRLHYRVRPVSTGSAAPIALADAECGWGRVAVAGCDARFCRLVGR